MIRTMLTTTAAMALLTGIAGSLIAAPCRDAKGYFAKCPPAAAAPAARCKDAKGKFAKCGMPGAAPLARK